MTDLIAQGQDAADRWRRSLPKGERVVVGRDATWATPWDKRISREHVELLWDGQQLEVRKLPPARNPIFFHGKQPAQITLRPGEHFIIGKTTFMLVDDPVEFSVEVQTPAQELAFSSQSLRRVHFQNADQRIEVLSELPKMIATASSDTELFLNMVNMLMAGIPRSDVVAIVTASLDEAPGKRARLLQWDRRRLTSSRFVPSERLIVRAFEGQQSVAHVWSRTSHSQMFTASEDIDWAFCTPIGGRGDNCWAIYVSGQFPSGMPDSSSATDPTGLRDDIKFTEIVASLVRSLRDLRELERRTAGLAQFFSPVVLDAISSHEPDTALAPRASEVAVLFCDLRGFSRASEQAGDDLFELLNRVSETLGVTTREILNEGGVVGDFHGDAVMGFWGWPLPQDDAAVRACRAALNIRSQFDLAARQIDSPLSQFRLGIGIATGQAVAGKIGTVDQVKVTVFGPVVNLASRLEGMTKILKSPILVDTRTAEIVRQHVSPDVMRLRRVAEVRPFGLDTSLEVSELLPPASDSSALTDKDIMHYEAAVDAFHNGDWEEAFALLDSVAPSDHVKDFLMVYIAQHNRTAPADWKGVIELHSKS